MSWNKDDFTQYNRAVSPWFHVSVNGKVDIGDKSGEGGRKISLQPFGVYKLVYQWLESGHGLSEEQKSKLKELLK